MNLDYLRLKVAPEPNTITNLYTGQQYPGPGFNYSQKGFIQYIPATTTPKQNVSMLNLHGGGYFELTWNELYAPCAWANSLGYDCFTLIYHLYPDTIPKPQQDLNLALSYIKKNADIFNASFVGTMGFSAGGHLSALMNHVHVYPDFRLLFYPVITYLKEAKKVVGCALPNGTSSHSVYQVSVENFITRNNARPAFVAHGTLDYLVPVYHSKYYAAILRALGVEVELLLVEGQGHAFDSKFWAKKCEEWLEKILLKIRQK